MTIVEFNTEHCGFEYDPSPAAKTVMNYTTGKTQSNQDTRIVNQYSSYTGLLWKKGIDASWTVDQKVEQDYIIMRYADVLLIYAEAMIELNRIDDSVLKAINMVRARAYGVNVTATDSYPAVTTTDQTELRRALRIERRMEFAMEGDRFFDLVRWGVAAETMNSYIGVEQNKRVYYRGARFVRGRDEYLPIPNAQYNFSEGNYVQNPGYGKFN
jgi:hypothetical protein